MDVTGKGLLVEPPNKPYLQLGLDMGPASCGFALIDTSNNAILELGAHLFDMPTESKTNTSLAKKRRDARSVRRNTKRKRDRQKHCLAILVNQGLVPDGSTKEWMHTIKGDLPVIVLRARGLDELLNARQFAQVLYNLSSRRGYIPHGEDGSTGDRDTGKVLGAIGKNEKRMSECGYRTVGEMLCSEGRSRNNKGTYELCVRHDQIVDEVKALFDAQRRLGSTYATSELEETYLKCLSWEKRSTDHDRKVYGRVGYCVYFPKERRAARADLSSEICAAYERFCNITILDEDENELKIPKSKIDEYVGAIFSPTAQKRAKLTYAKIAKDLDLSSRCSFKGIDPGKMKTEEPYVPRSWRALCASGLSKDLLLRMANDRSLADGIGEALTYASSRDSLSERLALLDLSESEMSQLLKVPFASRNFNGYGTRSIKALHILLDMFEDPEITTLAQAEEASGLKDLRLGRKYERGTTLCSYEVYDPTCTNPVVLRALSRARKVVNAIIRIHGVPDEIHVELAGELKHSAREKRIISARQRENEARNRLLARMAAEILGVDETEVGRKVIAKLALHEEQGGMDAYTGDPIDLERLLKEDYYCQIDHILPYSRTCDDSGLNKVLVLAKSNQDKGNHTPYEWMTEVEGSPSWDHFKERVLASPKLARKRRYLLNTSLGQDEQGGFIERNLNDTRYMARAVKEWLENTLEFPEGKRERHVIAVSGGATAKLRYSWGLNFGAGNTKDRGDHRHHAVDAAVIAACSHRAIQLVAKARSSETANGRRKHESRLPETQPWETFAEEVASLREAVVPTRMVSHKLTGRAFQDMAYGFDGISEDRKRYAIIHRQNKTKRVGNYVVDKAGAVRLVDGMAFVRLWLDPYAQGRGAWKIEPVYYADIPAIANKTYIPRYVKTNTARTSWPVLPEDILATRPIELFRNDVLSVDGIMARFKELKISSGRLIMHDIRTDEPFAGIPTVNNWTPETIVRIVEEDCLGHCYRRIVLGDSGR